MSGFDRALGALSRQEMLECARGLLRVLAGAEARGASGAGGGLGLDGGVRRSGGRGVSAEAGAFGAGARDLTEAGRAGRGAAEMQALGRAGRGFERLESGEGRREFGGETGDLERRERALGLSVRARERSGEGEERDAGQTAGFLGPERRYENAVGARGMEMSRVSDYFRRDSRRYDAGFNRY